ncbi:VRR-NUC domain-containing protein [Deinococcus peraridilitoris]|uniref:VRR-NUC domain-containing protein n=1 Tax=Deinococcus peraridilitoris (strain DSM 19664 / LMG 22246 / CIP 109416 / KR-200) TaxID=937777 RepID=K9ZZH7_DEIPD|nr:VRR-NUC domain-containing protein [Deinococcus peraridilitoris]AFZ67006.1 VRR-NUC domain-containing protein [Deinococcus peraridilitoris DSM 19664]
MNEDQLARYKRKHPHLFAPEESVATPVPTGPSATERELQADIVAEFGNLGWICWELFKGSTRGGAIWCTTGIPDLYVFRPGRAFWLELKQPGNGPTPEQLARHAELRRAGLPIFVAWTVEEALLIAQEMETR